MKVGNSAYGSLKTIEEVCTAVEDATTFISETENTKPISVDNLKLAAEKIYTEYKSSVEVPPLLVVVQMEGGELRMAAYSDVSSVDYTAIAEAVRSCAVYTALEKGELVVSVAAVILTADIRVVPIGGDSREDGGVEYSEDSCATADAMTIIVMDILADEDSAMLGWRAISGEEGLGEWEPCTVPEDITAGAFIGLYESLVYRFMDLKNEDDITEVRDSVYAVLMQKVAEDEDNCCPEGVTIH